jgi:hypothetical protein
MTTYDTSDVTTEVATPYTFSATEAARIQASLTRNGLAVIRGFIPPADLRELQASARSATESRYSYGREVGCNAATTVSAAAQEFRHPFLVSATATRLATNGPLLDIMEETMGEKAIIHHGLFQRSLPLENAVLDWHIDTGSNKSLNGRQKFEDLRVRMIVYLTDVTNGGFSYIVESSKEALKTFYPLPAGELFPEDQIPSDLSRRVTVNERAGAIILFNTHGLHRPEVPKTERMVLNVWFARRDFSGKLPSALVSMNLVPNDQRDRAYVFANERGYDPLKAGAGAAAQPVSFTQRVARRLARSLAG